MPEVSKRYQVLVRAKEVLSSISAGDDYFFTPGHVEIGIRSIDEVKAFPAYFLSIGTAGEVSEYGSGFTWEAFDLVVDGWVKGNEDLPLMVEKAISDVRKAIMADYENLTSGLGSIVLTLKIKGGPETDEGALASLGFGFFEQRFMITVENI
jgi:hypothetical protein